MSLLKTCIVVLAFVALSDATKIHLHRKPRVVTQYVQVPTHEYGHSQYGGHGHYDHSSQHSYPSHHGHVLQNGNHGYQGHQGHLGGGGSAAAAAAAGGASAAAAASAPAHFYPEEDFYHHEPEVHYVPQYHHEPIHYPPAVHHNAPAHHEPACIAPCYGGLVAQQNAEMKDSRGFLGLGRRKSRPVIQQQFINAHH